MERRVSVATGWASTRIAVLDSEDRYEDSYAVTQEFREWITCLGETTRCSRKHAVRNPDKRYRLLGQNSSDNPLKSEEILKFRKIVD